MEQDTIKLALLPLSDEQKEMVTRLINGMDAQQLSWFSGYLAGVMAGQGTMTNRNGNSTGLPGAPAGNGQSTGRNARNGNGRSTGIQDTLLSPQPQSGVNSQESLTQAAELTILYGSKSGNSIAVARQAEEKAGEMGFAVKCLNMAEYKPRNLRKEKNLMVIVSTDGEGVPPFAAEELHEYLHSKKAQGLNGINYSVCALGDSSYVYFCKTGIDFDNQLAELGGNRILERKECDLDFEEPAGKWIQDALEKFAAQSGMNGKLAFSGSEDIPSAPGEDTRGSVSMKHAAGAPAQPQEAVSGEMPSGMALETQVVFSKKNPFPAPVLEKIGLNGRGSGKETYHLELSLEDSGLSYRPGDAIGILPRNSERAVNELLEALKMDPSVRVEFEDSTIDLKTALTNHFEITTLTRKVLQDYNSLANSKAISGIASDPEKLKSFVYGRDVLDLIKEYPVPLKPGDLTRVLRKLQPRLYSLASSLEAFPGEAHILVGGVRYHSNNRYKEGVCSSYLIDHVGLDHTLPVYIDRNELFKLPAEGEKPVIMIGPGTGVAPFRAFLQEREMMEHTGKNWLFFGDWNFSTDFLYQTEWQKLIKYGFLHRMDVAFSRDQRDKYYVQHKMKARGKELFAWLEEGACIYVCGDMHRMAPDVNSALMDIVQNQGGLNADAAAEYVTSLKKQNRYLEDIY